MASKEEKGKEYLDNLRHSCSHLLAAAVLELWPDTKQAIGPPIENGFYYDFEFKTPISEEDFPKIEKKMRQILGGWRKFEKKEASIEEARDVFRSNKYKLELIAEFAKEGKKLTIYQCGNYVDLCKGGHVENPSKEIGALKILNLAGAYWRGSEKNKMLTRIYATCFPTENELKAYLNMLEEAKKRDHKILGPQLGLFMFHETSPGMPYWLPEGLAIYNKLIDFWRKEHLRQRYKEIFSPLINKKELYVTSGHWEHYKEHMFIAPAGENETYCLKPMNCPNAMIVFQSTQRSYKDLPLRLSDTDRLHRFEKSGTLNGLLRVRSFQQDDSHNFITEDMIGKEYAHLFELCEKFYSIFGLKYKFRFGTRPEKFIGEAKTWDKAEATLKEILKKSKVPYSTLEGDGAFY
ncbi:MAG: threonine--tRNA ligase, partial [Nanoarchaeota archaeon]